MGCSNSNIQKDYQQKLLLIAINDDQEYKKYTFIRDLFVRTLENHDPFIYKQLVRIVHQYIKSSRTSGLQKFNALLILKDLMKVQNFQLVEQVQKSLLDRLFLLASDPNGNNILGKINPKIGAEQSKAF